MIFDELKKPLEDLAKLLIYFCQDNLGKKNPDTAPIRVGFLTFHMALDVIIAKREQEIWEAVRDRAFLNNDLKTYAWAKTKLHKVTVQ